MLQAIRPDLAVYQGPFERWVREYGARTGGVRRGSEATPPEGGRSWTDRQPHGDEYAGRIKLVVSNPPYGARGVSVTEDPVRAYREKHAYAYFLRRGLDLLAPNGLGVYLVPSGFLTGRAARNVSLRTKVLLRHHLSAAYRLPSGFFPGAHLVTTPLWSNAVLPLPRRPAH